MTTSIKTVEFTSSNKSSSRSSKRSSARMNLCVERGLKFLERSEKAGCRRKIVISPGTIRLTSQILRVQLY